MGPNLLVGQWRQVYLILEYMKKYGGLLLKTKGIEYQGTPQPNPHTMVNFKCRGTNDICLDMGSNLG